MSKQFINLRIEELLNINKEMQKKDNLIDKYMIRLDNKRIQLEKRRLEIEEIEKEYYCRYQVIIII